MSHRGRESADDRLAQALAAGKTQGDAAAEAGVSRRTVGRRLDDPAFAARVTKLRGAMLSAAAGKLADGMTAAADKLRTLVDADDGHLAHKASVKLIELGFKAAEIMDLEQRLQAIEARLITTEKQS